MAKTPPLLSSREIKEMVADCTRKLEGIKRAIEELDVAISSLPRGQDKRELLARQDELKRQSGLFPDYEQRRLPREGRTWLKLVTKAFELKDAARKWKAAGHLDRANKCLKEARAIEREIANRQEAERTRTSPSG